MAPLLGIIGTIASIGGTIAGASAQKQQADYQAAVQRQQAALQQAEGTRAAQDDTTKKNLLQSKQQAAQAASGAGRINGSGLQIADDTERQGSYLSASDIFKGQLGALNANEAAQMDTMRGNAAMTAGMFDAASAGASGFGKLYADNGTGGGTGGWSTTTWLD